MKKRKKRGKKNPAVVIAGNPKGRRHAKSNRRKGAKKAGAKKNPSVHRRGSSTGPVLSTDVSEVRYIRADDGKPYYHPFKRGTVRLVCLSDGSLRLVPKFGVRLWKEFQS